MDFRASVIFISCEKKVVFNNILWRICQEQDEAPLPSFSRQVLHGVGSKSLRSRVEAAAQQTPLLFLHR